MKFRGKLPDRKHYLSSKVTNEYFIFHDYQTDLIQIKSPVINPFDREWNILIGTQFGKSDKTKYLSRVQFKLFLPEPGIEPATLTRTCVKAKLLSFPVENYKHVIEAKGRNGIIRVIYTVR